LARHVRQGINRAINQFYADHVGYQVAYEGLSVRIMRFKAKRMNAYLRAAHLSHLPRQLAWGARKRGQRARSSQAAYWSQECARCHYVSRANRPDQRTFRCQACGFTINADENAALNHQARFDDRKMRACTTKDEVRTLLHARHVGYLEQTGGRSLPARREPAFGRESLMGQSGVGHHSRPDGRKHQRPAS